MIETTMARPLLALLHVSDSLFPIGGFGYSDGLEAATAAGLGETPADRGRGADGRCRRSRNKRRIDSVTGLHEDGRAEEVRRDRSSCAEVHDV
jgi:hypothetical protein